ncbi:MAG: O-methyltransferase, partial [Vicinamibacterales bacterium]
EAVERYLSSLNTLEDQVLQQVARDGQDAQLPLVDAEVGALLRVLVHATQANRVLELGTCIGYSGIWLAGGLPPGGMLITMEIDPARSRTAKENFSRAGLADRVSVMTGDARLLVAKVAGPFDVVFQDAGKQMYGPMLDRLVSLLRPGGLLVTDNVLWDGEVVPGYVAAPRRDPADTAAIAEYNRRITTHPQLMTAILPIRDGVALSVKTHVH